MATYRELLYENNISPIRGVQFCVLSPQDILQRSVVEVTRTETYAGNEPQPNGLFDTRMGVMDLGKTCATCEQKNTFCQGHFGHITLAKPVFYVKFLPVVLKILQCVCFRCSKLLMNVDAPEVQALQSRKYARPKRWEEMYKLCSRVKTCPCCRARQPDKIKENEQMLIRMEWRDSENVTQSELVIGAEDVLRIFTRVTEEDGEALGFSSKFNRPEWLICTVLPVPPPAVRPSVRNDTGLRSDDDLTHILSDIVKYNNSLRAKIAQGASHDSVVWMTMILQYHVATLVDNSVPTMYVTSKDRTGRPLRTLVERLKSKEGRIRGNLMGKRVDFSARTVITPDPNVSIDELGVPLQIAMNITFPDVVRPANFDEMQAYVRNGPDAYPGAKHVRKAHQGMRTVRLKGNNTALVARDLEMGDVVERHLRNGDYVLFNRQPSLHKMSMMAHRVRVMPNKSFRLNVCVCSSYNADFDGDEMNMHIPQSLQTHEEIKHLAAVPLHVISPRHSKPIVTIVQDVTLGVYRMTHPAVRIPRSLFMNLTCSNPMYDGLLPAAASGDADADADAELLTGRQLLSTVIPPNTNVAFSKFRVTDGQVDPSSDPLTSKAYKAESKGLVHSVYNDKGAAELTTFVNNTQKLVCDWLVYNGFSVGISDLVLTKETRAQVHAAMARMKDEVNAIIQDLHNNRFENKSTRSKAEHFENVLLGILSGGKTDAEKAAMQSFAGDDRNRMLSMISAGSKGNVLNFSQMVANVGQQVVDDKRITEDFDNRTLPHFTKYDDGPTSRGFVENSFIEGLSPHEFFFHSKGGRIGLIDTAVRSVTWDTPVVIVEDGRCKRVCIGDWIDTHMAAANAADIKRYPEQRDLELLELGDAAASIVTVDAEGNASWGALTAVTRHDPGEALYEVRTRGGRCATVSDGESLLVWREEAQRFEKARPADVRVGDALPVVARFPAPSERVDAVNVEEFLSKIEHVYGTDFHKAARGIQEAMQGRVRIPPGWWNAHNGRDFQLPYAKKSSVTRMLSGRSNIDNIHDGVVYPFKATRCHGHMPDRFALSFENGVFIGLFLADGHTHAPSGIVGITKNDEHVRAWADAWFHKHGFTTHTQDNSDFSGRKNVQGTSISIQGHSTLLARFLDAFVGHGAQNKRVPDVAYVAPEDFVRGLLSGYVSGDGCVKEYGIESSSVSPVLTEGIAALCARLGAFAKISVADTNPRPEAKPLHCASVKSLWARVLADKLELIHPDKHAALLAIRTSVEHRNFPTVNDVVLDTVEALARRPPLPGTKLYDVTVPSTLNFVLANGLGVDDTSETGYLQRKLVKSMEDCKVNQDMSVRNAAGHVVQFLYGEDAADAAKLEYHAVPYMGYDDAAFRDAYLLASLDELRPFVREDVVDSLARREGGEERFRAAMAAHYAQLRADRRFVNACVNGGQNSGDGGVVVFPVNLQRIVQNTAQLAHKYTAGGARVTVDLDPLYVLDAVRALEDELTVGRRDAPTRVPVMGVLLRCFLAPKQLLVKHRLGAAAFEHVLQAVRKAYRASLATPGEAVGITAAQSISEPTTQLSTIFSTQLRVWYRDSRTNDAPQLYCGPMGAFIDDILAAQPHRVVDLGGGSVVMDLERGLDYHIVGVSDDEKTSWRRISQVSRHPANGGLVRVHTKSGKSTCATLSHSFLKRTTAGIAPVPGHALKAGDRIPVTRHIPTVPEPLQTITIGGLEYELTRDLGWLFGAYLADGSVGGNVLHISKVIPEYQDKLRAIVWDVFGAEMRQRTRRGHNDLHGYDMSAYEGTDNYITHEHLCRFLVDHFRAGSFQKRVPAFVYASNLDFIRGVIGGYFDGDGNVGTGYAKSTVRSASVSEELTEDVILLLAYVGVFACKCRERHLATPQRNDLFTVQVLRKFAPKFRDEIGFVVRSKADALDALVDYVLREDAHSRKDETDMIPDLGDTLAFVGRTLKLDGHSRLFGRFTKKEAIGRETLRNAVRTFEDEAFAMAAASDEWYDENRRKLRELRELSAQAKPDAYKRIALTPLQGRILEEVGESVKDKGKKPGGKHAQAARAGWVHADILRRFVADFGEANESKKRAVIAAVDAIEPHMAVLRQALHADVVWDEIVALEHLPDPGEMVYDFTVPGNDSFMVDCGVLVHNTLNSVHYDEELLLAVDGKLARVKIGDFTHGVLDAAAADDPGAVEDHPNDTRLGWIRDGRDVKILSCDEEGKVTWERVEAVTRHPVVNEDGSDTLLHVKTRTGREVTATKAKSFLKRVNNRIVGVNGADLRVGDRLPVSTVLPTRTVAAVDYLDLADFLSPSEWLYTSHVEAALRFREELGGRRSWFQRLPSQGIYVPYSRGDALLDGFVGTPAKPPKRRGSTRAGCVYPANATRTADGNAHVPERLPLDADFGFLVGAYLADGCIATSSNGRSPPRPYAVLVCNMSQEFRARFERFCERYDIGYHVNGGTRLMASGNRSPTVSLRMHSLMFGELFMRLFGQGADVKRVHPALLGAPDEFLYALLDGYWSGDGCVSNNANMMTAYSASKGMLQDIQQIMVRFGVPTSITQISEHVHRYNLEKHISSVRGWTMYVPACGCARFRELIDLSLQRKRQRLENMGDIASTHAVYDKVPDVQLSTGTFAVNRSRIPFMLEGTEHAGDREVLQRILDEGIFYDEVADIQEVPNGPERQYVYDLTVERTRNFAVYNGLSVSDTFHTAGVSSSASGTITQGVPRLKELFNVSRNIKTPAMTIAVKPEFAHDMAKCTEIMNGIQTARFRDVVRSSRIYYDPSDDPQRTLVEEDRGLLATYAAYADFMGTCNRRASPWVLRFEFDHDAMLKLSVFSTDIDFALRNFYEDAISCIFSDDNSHKLVCRVRLLPAPTVDRDDILTELMALEQGILESVVIKGVRNVERAVLEPPKPVNKTYDPAADAFVDNPEWRILTAGTNLVDVMANPYVDYTRTETNDISEVYRVLGIEAARAALLNELRNVMWMADQHNVNYRHMALLVDTMTNRGHLVSIDRHGINKGDNGPLAKSSFEETDEMLIRAGIFCELDRINGVSANIMIGQVPPCGTGEGDVFVDVDAITQHVREADIHAGFGHAGREAIRATTSAEGEERERERSANAAPDVKLPEKDAGVIAQEEDAVVIV